MKMKSIIYCLLATSILFFSACSIEKRVHRNGFHVSWKKNYQTEEGESADRAVTAAQKVTVVDAEPLSKTTEESVQLLNAETASHDHVVDVQQDKSNYLPSDHAMNAPVSTENSNTDAAKANDHASETKHTQPDLSKKTLADGGGKSQVVALILVLLVGVLGIHRFYLGYTGIGILMLLTVGCCGILALIDLIRIITGDLKPRNSDYTETL